LRCSLKISINRLVDFGNGFMVLKVVQLGSI